MARGGDPARVGGSGLAQLGSGLLSIMGISGYVRGWVCIFSVYSQNSKEKEKIKMKNCGSDTKKNLTIVGVKLTCLKREIVMYIYIMKLGLHIKRKTIIGLT
jgi:hypothetical protein